MSDFGKWWDNSNEKKGYKNGYGLDDVDIKQAYEAGRKAGVDEGHTIGLEEAAEICDPFKFDNACDRVVAREIAAAIRERIK